MTVLQCPSCGGRLERMNPGIVVAVCEYCATTLYREGAVLHAGERSILAAPRSALHVGAVGELGRRRVRAEGRIQYATLDGTSSWDEWYLTDLATGEGLWLSEDGRRYTLEHDAGRIALPPAFEPAVGRTLEHDGIGFEITEVGEAVCVGGQGRLARDLRPGERYRFVDARKLGATEILGLEFGPGEDAPIGFYGEEVHPSALSFEPPPPFEGPPAEIASAIQCTACGAGFTLKRQGDPVRTATCGSCGSQLELTPAGARVLSRNESVVPFALELGDGMTRDGLRYEVMGRLVYTEDEDGEVYYTREYLLWGPAGGYLWLTEYKGHFIVFEPTSAGPRLGDLASAGRFEEFEVDGESFRCFESGRRILHYVDGALPWLARRGDGHRYIDMIAPPRIFSVELTGSREQERFLGTWVPAAEIHEAFEKQPAPPSPIVHPAEPPLLTPSQRWTAWTCTFFALLNFGIAMTAGPGAVLYDADIPGALMPATIRSDAMDLKRGDVLGFEVRCPRGELQVDAMLRPARPDDDILVPGGGVMNGEYLHQRRLRSLDDGPQVLEATVALDPPADVRIRLRAPGRSGTPPFWVGLLMLIYPASCGWRSRVHEARRWSGE